MLALLCDLAYNKSYNYDTGNYIGLLVIKISQLFAHGFAKFLLSMNGNPLALVYVERRA